MEKDLANLIEERRWLVRAVAVIALTVVGQLVVAAIKQLAG